MTMEWDVIVVGSGASGLTAALRAAKDGLKVLVLEKADSFGGTTAVSGGGIWVPENPLAVAQGLKDTKAVARKYVLDLIGETANPALIDAYLDNGPEMVKWLHETSTVEFLLSPPSSDWYPEVPGAVDYGRLLSPKEYDGSKLGDYFTQLRLPREEFNAPGGMMIDLFDLAYISKLPSPGSLWYMAKIAGKFTLDKFKYPRGTRLTMGNALAGRLIKSVLDAGVTLRRSTSVAELLKEGNRITGVKASSGGKTEDLKARVGVVLASGGFSANKQLRKAYMPYPEQHISILPYENTGDGMNMGLDAGASLDGENFKNGVWSVVSTMTRPDGYVARYAHLIDMSKPGCIGVNKNGERFGNEASVHFVDAMHESGAVPAHIIADSKFVKKYGMGMVLPGGGGLKKLVEAGYIIEAPTLRELAAKINIDGLGLEKTVAKMNGYAKTGVDPDFHKGDSQIDKEIGDPSHGPNPCLGVVEAGPFYAIKIFPGDGSTTVGLKIDGKCRVLNASGQAIDGLYAAGLDANSIWRGKSPGHGCNVGPAMVLGYIAGKSLSAQKAAA
jgi:succinate dehydrogenase/fumarate reductase flavoprotein subunit